MTSDYDLSHTQSPNSSSATCTSQQKLRLTVIAFVINLFYFASAFLHLITATECKNYQNLVKNSNPIYNFKGVIEPLQINLVKYSLLNLFLLILNAGIILFGIRVKKFWFYLIPLILTLIGMSVSLAAPINVLSIVSEWNTINKNSQNVVTLYSSIFVGDLKVIQLLFRLQVFLGFFLFFLATVYSLFFWIIVLRDQYRLSKKEKKVNVQAKMVQIENKSSFAQQQEKVEKIIIPQGHELSQD